MKFANILATQGLIKKFESRGVLRSHRLKSFLNSELLTSQLGFGTYRVHVDSKEHETAMIVALQSGVNLIDTSSNYGLGGSEELISNVLDKMSKEDSRDSFIIITKSGYLQGEIFEYLKQLDQVEIKDLDVVKVSSNCWHSIHPDILKMQIDQSFKRMKIDGIDALLLHNPEYYLQDCFSQKIDVEIARKEFYKRIKKAFLFLEGQVQENKIKYYGVSSNSMCSDLSSFDQVSLVKLNEIAIECAKELYANEKHHFQVIQFPCNLLESNGIIHKNQLYKKATFSVMELANHLKLDVLFNRPLNAFFNGTMVRLAGGEFNPNINYKLEIEQVFLNISKLENTIKIYFKNHSKVLKNMQKTAKRSGFFDVSSSLPNFVENEHNNEQYFQMVQSWLWPYISSSLDCLHKFFEGDDYFDLSQFTNDYLKTFDKLEGFVVSRNNLLHEITNLKPLRDVLNISLSDSISQCALNLLASIKGQPIILNGMRQIDYIKDSTSILIEDDISNSEEILKEIDSVYKKN
ncbi:MAG: hypothetical protein COB02_12720 [Candidatus Cloacimonadota bacterium]|nr:MAG: hypothetical protein COB02_12720 [Candidatus Cloacimonadota bacterium]